MLSIDEKLKETYNNQYSDKLEEWRQTGAIGKVKNIMEVAGDLKFNKIADVGAGAGNILSLLSSYHFGNELTAIEISDSAIAQIKKKRIKRLQQIVPFDGYKIPFDDNSFDLAICSHVIEHVEYPRKLLQEIKRISRYQIFEVPIDFSFRVDKKFRHFTSYGHINIYTPALFKFLLKTEGFQLLNEKYALYDKSVLKLQLKDKPVLYFKTMVKRIVFKIVTPLMHYKPNTYTVLTNNDGQKPDLTLIDNDL